MFALQGPDKLQQLRAVGDAEDAAAEIDHGCHDGGLVGEPVVRPLRCWVWCREGEGEEGVLGDEQEVGLVGVLTPVA